MIVALMGINGSGKTSIARLLETRLREIGLDVEYHRGFDYGLLNFLTKIFPKKEVRSARAEFSEGRKKNLFYLWPFLVFFDCIIVYLNIKLFKRNKIMIFDRYFYDFLMSFEYLGYSNRVVRKLFLSLPKPDTGFILDVSPEVAYARKKNTRGFDINHYGIQREKYAELAKDFGIPTINTEKSLENQVDGILIEIERQLSLVERGLKT